jgi:RNA polymerase sigma factor (sigma-70 family)
MSAQLGDNMRVDYDEVIRIDEALEALQKLDERLVRIVEMRYFAGMTANEVAAVLGVADRTVRRDWEKARLLLMASLR